LDISPAHFFCEKKFELFALSICSRTHQSVILLTSEGQFRPPIKRECEYAADRPQDWCRLLLVLRRRPRPLPRQRPTFRAHAHRPGRQRSRHPRRRGSVHGRDRHHHRPRPALRRDGRPGLRAKKVLKKCEKILFTLHKTHYINSVGRAIRPTNKKGCTQWLNLTLPMTFSNSMPRPTHHSFSNPGWPVTPKVSAPPSSPPPKRASSNSFRKWNMHTAANTLMNSTSKKSRKASISSNSASHP